MKGEKEGRERKGKVDIGRSETRGCVDGSNISVFAIPISLTSVCLFNSKEPFRAGW